MKMYILVRDSIELGNAIAAVAHASLAAYLEYKDSPEVVEWLKGPFYKVVCKVSDKEFEAAKKVLDHVVVTEAKLDGAEVALAFKPRSEWPKSFKYFKLYR